MDDLLANAPAEVVQVLCGAVVGQRQHGDGVPAQERRADRAPLMRHRVATGEDGGVPALRQVDHDLVALSFLLVVLGEPGTQAPRLDADDRVRAGIERLFLAEHLHADDVFLQLAATARQRFEHDEAQEPLQAVDLLEYPAGQHALELPPDLLLSVLAERCRRTAGGHGRYSTAVVPPLAPGSSRPATTAGTSGCPVRRASRSPAEAVPPR